MCVCVGGVMWHLAVVSNGGADSLHPESLFGILS